MRNSAALVVIVSIATVLAAAVLSRIHRGIDWSGTPMSVTADVEGLRPETVRAQTRGAQSDDAPDPTEAVGEAERGRRLSDAIDRIEPDQIEQAVYQRIAEESGVALTVISSVECATLRCRIVFSGLEVNPRYVDTYGGLLRALMTPPWNDYQPTSSSLGTREVAPVVREYVLEFTYVTLEEASDDPRTGARRHPRQGAESHRSGGPISGLK